MTGFNLPEVIFGTSGLGNLYIALEDSVKLAIVKESIASPQNRLFLIPPGNMERAFRWNASENASNKAG
jgi:hypothetical protein